MEDDADLPLPPVDLRALNRTVKSIRAYLLDLREQTEAVGPLGWPTLGYSSFDDFIDRHGPGIREFWEKTCD